MKKIFAIGLSLFSLVIFGCGGDSGTGGGGGDDFEQENVVVYTTSTIPSIENINDAIWDSAAVTLVRVGHDTSYGVNSAFADDTMSLQAIVASDTLFLRARWRDYTADSAGNYIRKSSGTGSWELVNIADAGAGEDCLFIIFDGGNNGTEKADCASMCHATANSMSTTGGGQADAWAWRSGTTNPVKMAEDQWIRPTGTALTGDQLTSGNRLAYFTNWSQIGLQQPIFMHVTDTAYHGIYLYTTDTVAYFYLGYGWDAVQGYRMPAYYVDSTVYKDPNAGDRWDVKAMSGHSANYWTVVMKREMTTPSSIEATRYDMDFAGLDSIQVTIAISNHHTDIVEDGGWREHSGSIPFYLVFNRPTP